MAEDLFTVSCAVIVSSLGAFIWGLDAGNIDFILESSAFDIDVADPKLRRFFGRPRLEVDRLYEGFSIPSHEVGLIVSLFSVGCICSSLPMVSGFFLDRCGRRSSIITASAVFLVGCLLQANATWLAVFCCGRFISGCAVGLLAMVVPLYQSEIAPARLRGTMTCTFQLMLSAGMFVAACDQSNTIDRLGGGWRSVIRLQMIPALFMMLAMPFLPRSPRWLIQQGRRQEAWDTLVRLRGGPEHGEHLAEQEFQTILVDNLKSMCAKAPSWSEMFTGRVGKLVALGSVLQLLKQAVGMTAFMYFSPRIFGTLLQYGEHDLHELQTITNGVNFVATFLAVILADRLGRRPLLIAGGIGMTFATFLMGILGEYIRTQGPESLGSDWYHPRVACVLMFVMAFACTWGPIVWVYCCEIFPLQYRGRGVGVTTTMNWIGNFLVSLLTPALLDGLGFYTFFVFGFFGICALLIGYWLPETSGLALEDIGRVFDERFGDASAAHGSDATKECSSDIPNFSQKMFEGDVPEYGTRRIAGVNRTNYGSMCDGA